jgi:hypothetical protein
LGHSRLNFRLLRYQVGKLGSLKHFKRKNKRQLQ